jgi:hypothetical protein
MLRPTKEARTAAFAWSSEHDPTGTPSWHKVPTHLTLAIYIQSKVHATISLEDAIEEYKQPKPRERRFAPYALQNQ